MKKNSSKAKALTESQKAYARTATKLMIAAAIWRLWERVKEEDGVDQQWLADRLGKDKGNMSRLLKAPGNLTIETVADLLEAMNGRLTAFEVQRFNDLAALAHNYKDKRAEVSRFQYLVGTQQILSSQTFNESASDSAP